MNDANRVARTVRLRESPPIMKGIILAGGTGFEDAVLEAVGQVHRDAGFAESEIDAHHGHVTTAVTGGSAFPGCGGSERNCRLGLNKLTKKT